MEKKPIYTDVKYYLDKNGLEILERYRSDHSINKIVDTTGLSTYVIKNFIKSNGLFQDARKQFFITKDDLVQLYSIEHLSYQKIAMRFNVSTGCIADWCKKYSIEPHSLKTTTYDKHYFEIPGYKHNNYFAGLLAADGNISKDNKSFSIQLQERDKPLIEFLKNDIEYSGVTSYSPSKTSFVVKKISKQQAQYGFSIYDPTIVQHLRENYSIVPAKTLILQPPILTNELHIKQYIRGYIDGDGYIGQRYYYMDIGIMGTFELLSWMKHWCSTFIQEDIGKIKKIGKIYQLAFRNKKADKLYKILQIIPNCFDAGRKWQQPVIDYKEIHSQYMKTGKRSELWKGY